MVPSPDRIAIAAFVVVGVRIWPAIFAGALFYNLTTAGSLVTSLGIATGNTLEGVIGASLVSSCSGPQTGRCMG
jgi:integral membrane sensor domain MASE1